MISVSPALIFMQEMKRHHAHIRLHVAVDRCGHCVDICPSDIMHIDTTYRRAYNIEPNMCWECYSCVKACPQMRSTFEAMPISHHWVTRSRC